MSQDYKYFVERMGSFEMDLDFDVVGDTITNEKNQNELKHYGVLGMKWGVRKSTNQVKTSTSKKKSEEKEIIEKNKKIKSERRQLSKNRRSLSDEELKLAIGRLETEKKLKELTKQDIENGRSSATKMLIDIGESSIKAAGTAVGTYAIKAILDGKFDRKEAAKFIRPKKK